MPTFRQHDTVADLAQRIDRLRGEAKELEQLSPEAWNAPPPRGGWSVGQVVEHLAVSNEDYLPLLRSLIERGTPHARVAEHAEWKPRLVAGFLWRSLAKEDNRLPAPARIRPSAVVPTDALPRYLRTLDECAALLPQAAPLPWNVLVGRSPLSSLVRPNLGDVLMTIVTHAERHHRQIRRIQNGRGAGPSNVRG